MVSNKNIKFVVNTDDEEILKYCYKKINWIVIREKDTRTNKFKCF